jgi:hypothetical protein
MLASTHHSKTSRAGKKCGRKQGKLTVWWLPIQLSLDLTSVVRITLSFEGVEVPQSALPSRDRDLSLSTISKPAVRPTQPPGSLRGWGMMLTTHPHRFFFFLWLILQTLSISSLYCAGWWDDWSCRIWGSHSSAYEEYHLLGCEAV